MTADDPSAHGVTRHDVARGAGTALLSRLGAVIEVVAQPAYVAMFGLATYGLYTVLWALVNLVENIADLGMTSALQRTVPQARDEAGAVATLRVALMLGVAPSVAIAAIASASAPWLATIINVAAEDRPALVTGIALFAWALPLWAFVEISTSALRARRVFGREIRLRIVWEQVFRLTLATLLWAAGVDTLGMLLAHLASLTITALISVRLLSRYYDLRLLVRSPKRGVAADTLLAGISVLPANIIVRLFGDAPAIILNASIPGAGGATAAGLYGIARKLSSLVQLVRMAFSYVMGPLASAVARHDRAAIEPLYAFATRLSTVLALPIAATLVGGADILLRVFGSAAAPAAALLLPLVAARTVDAIAGPAGAIQQVASRRIQPVIASMIGLLVAVLLGLALFDGWGPTGIAIAVGSGLIVSGLTSLLQLRYVDRLSPFGPPFARMLGVTVAASLLALALLAGTQSLPFVPRAMLVPVALLGSLWLSIRFGLGEQDKQAFGRLGDRLRLRKPV